jgi:ppGpp synthetase/RelA/SpoT-type nucleotidyltranferase
MLDGRRAYRFQCPHCKLGPNEFGYRSVYVVIGLDGPRASMGEWKRFANLWAEIQIKSLLQHTWAMMNHMLVYKRQSQVPKELRRQLSRLSAILELADEEFAILRDRKC